MAFLLNNTSIASHFKSSSPKTDGAFAQSRRGFHVELGPREKAVKHDDEDCRLMNREGLEGSPFHTLLVEGYIDGPIQDCSQSLYFLHSRSYKRSACKSLG